MFGLTVLWAHKLALGENKRLDRRVRVREGIMKTEVEGGVMWGYEPRNVVVFRSWKRKGNGYSLETPEGTQC